MFLNVLLLLILLLVSVIYHLKYRTKTQAEIEDLKLTNKLNAENKKQQPNGSLSNLAAQNKEQNKRMDKLVDAVEALNHQLDKLRDEKNEAIMAYAKIEREMALIQQKNVEAEKNLAEWKQIHEDSLKNTKVIIAQFIGKIYKHLASSGKLNTSDLSHILKKEGVESYNSTQKPVARMVFKGKKGEVLGAMQKGGEVATEAEAQNEAEESTKEVSEKQPQELESVKGIDEMVDYKKPKEIEVPEIEESVSLKNIAKETEERSNKELREELEATGGKVYRKTEEVSEAEQQAEQKVDWDGNHIEEEGYEIEPTEDTFNVRGDSDEMESFLSKDEEVKVSGEDSRTREDYLSTLDQISKKITSLKEGDFEVTPKALNNSEDDEEVFEEEKR